jgi:hypothetical protein
VPRGSTDAQLVLQEKNPLMSAAGIALAGLQGAVWERALAAAFFGGAPKED